jgi:hypothetical protein
LLRRVALGVLGSVAFILLDRSTVFLQMWPDISAWYPPVAFALAILIAFGPLALPTVLAGAYLSSLLNYAQKLDSIGFLLLNPVVVTIYFLAALVTRRWIAADRRLHTMNDIVRFLGTCLVASFSGAFLGTGLLALQGGVKWVDYGIAAFNWWVGDAVALSSVTPFLLELVLPPVRRFLGAKHAIVAPESGAHASDFGYADSACGKQRGKSAVNSTHAGEDGSRGDHRDARCAGSGTFGAERVRSGLDGYAHAGDGRARCHEEFERAKRPESDTLRLWR